MQLNMLLEKERQLELSIGIACYKEDLDMHSRDRFFVCLEVL